MRRDRERAALWPGAPPASGQRVLAALLERIAVPAPLVAGAAYLQGHPAEAEPERLLELLFSPDAARDVAGLLAAFERRLRREFARGETVVVDGWWLSRSEARLCALLALCAPAPA